VSNLPLQKHHVKRTYTKVNIIYLVKVNKAKTLKTNNKIAKSLRSDSLFTKPDLKIFLYRLNENYGR
jgi:hypothetical protein